MSKPRRNKALLVLDDRLAEARAEYQRRLNAAEEAGAVVKEVIAVREQVAKAYERKGAGKTPKQSAHAKAVKILDDAAAKAIRERNARQANDLSEPGQVNDAARQRAQATATETPL